jgi:PAS domain-containing protein
LPENSGLYERRNTTAFCRRSFAEGEWEKALRMLRKGDEENPISFSETKLIRKDGAGIPVLSNGQKVEIHGITYLLLSARDVSEIKSKDIALKESEERYKELVENIGEGNWAC